MTEEFERATIKQTRGPTVVFSGELLASTEFRTTSRMATTMTMEVWETQGGAYVAVSRSEPIDGGGFADVRALVVDPVVLNELAPASARDHVELQRRIAVMDFFGWDNRARSMARKELGWKLVLEVA